MNLRYLKIFAAVAEAGSIRAAARGSVLTQPAITYAMRELEQSVGAQLLVRSARGVKLTPIGEALLRRARLLFNEVRRTEEEIAQLRDGTGGQLRVAFSSFAVERLLPNALLAFRSQWPSVALELHEFSGGDAKSLWRHGDFDFAIVGELESAGDTAAPDVLDREILLDFPRRVIAKVGHPLARARSMAQLQDAMWVVPSYGVELLQRAFSELKMATPGDIVVTQSWQLAMTLVREANALTLAGAMPLPKSLIGLRLSAPLPRMHIALLMRDRTALTPAARAFSDALKAVAHDLRSVRA